jgi:hypothetical protein
MDEVGPLECLPWEGLSVSLCELAGCSQVHRSVGKSGTCLSCRCATFLQRSWENIADMMWTDDTGFGAGRWGRPPNPTIHIIVRPYNSYSCFKSLCFRLVHCIAIDN